jgi:hypothetical protein
LLGKAPGELELLLRVLKNKGLLVREVAALRAAIKREHRRLKRERTQQQRTTRATARQELAFRNYFNAETKSEEGKCVQVAVGYPVETIADKLAQIATGWPKRIDSLLFARDGDDPVWLESTSALFAWLSRQLPQAENPQHEPTNLLEWKIGANMVPQDRFTAYLRQTVEHFRSLERTPHYPTMPETYYLHPALKGGNGDALRELCSRFCPASDIDADLVEAFFLSLFWGGKPGSRPAWLFTADEDDDQKGRGVGKTSLAEMGAALTGGYIMARPTEDVEALLKRLLTPSALTYRVVLIDNIKTLKFSWADLEQLVTCPTISGYRLYHGEAQRPNTLTYCLTLNGATLGKDMSQRCVIVKLKRPKHDAPWKERTLELIASRRWEIVGDIIARLKQPGGALAKHSRWGSWEDAVLTRLPEPIDAQRVIEERQADVDDDVEESALVRQAFIAFLAERRHDPDTQRVNFPSRVVAEIVNTATGEKRATCRASAFLKTLSIPELRPGRHGEARGWTWWGKDADAAQPAVDLNAPSVWAP